MNPYAKYLENREPVMVLSETVEMLPEIVEKIGDKNMNRQLIKGKWTANEILRHLAHVEMLHPSRIRFALTTENFVVQPFDQDDWMKREPNISWDTTLNAILHQRQFNLALFQSISAEEKQRPVTHPEIGKLNVGILLELFAGHDLNHLLQLEALVE